MAILRIGHRGAAGRVLENTLASVEYALAFGVEFIEVDLRLTRDQEIVVLHDETVDRTTDGSGAVADLTLMQLKRFKTRNGETIPTLAGLLAFVGGRAGLVLELKVTGMAEAAAMRVHESGFRRPVIYASFLHDEVFHVRSMRPEAPTMALLKKGEIPPIIFAARNLLSHVGLPIESLTKDRVEALHAIGLSVFVFTVNEPHQIEWAASQRVDGIISDYPDRLVQLPR